MEVFLFRTLEPLSYRMVIARLGRSPSCEDGVTAILRDQNAIFDEHAFDCKFSFLNRMRVSVTCGRHSL